MNGSRHRHRDVAHRSTGCFRGLPIVMGVGTSRGLTSVVLACVGALAVLTIGATVAGYRSLAIVALTLLVLVGVVTVVDLRRRVLSETSAIRSKLRTSLATEQQGRAATTAALERIEERLETTAGADELAELRGLVNRLRAEREVEEATEPPPEPPRQRIRVVDRGA